MQKTKILMVCLGNICRSPLAEAILSDKLDPQKFLVDSAGTGSWHIGHSPDPRSIQIAKKNGLNISQQRGRQFTGTAFNTFDFIYVMDRSNFKNVISLAEKDSDITKVSLILDILYPNLQKDVPDPYYGGDDGFENVYKLLDEACNLIARQLQKE